MSKSLQFSIAILVAIFFFLPSAEAFNLYDYFPNLVPGQDPGQPDTLYTVCESQTAGQQVIQIRLKTDNVGALDSVAGAFIPLLLTTDKPGVVLDTTEATTFSGTASLVWEGLAVDVQTSGGNPGSFPMTVLIGGVSLDPSGFLGPGDHLLARLVFSLSEPTKICVDSTQLDIAPRRGDVYLVTAQPVDYVPQWYKDCCGPAVPTLSEWGLILFSLLLLASIVWYLKRVKKVYA